MRLLAQLGIIAGLAVAAVPLSARFLPASHPVLERIGLLQPMAAMGVLPAPEEGAGQDSAGARGGQWGGGQGGGVPVVAVAPELVQLRDVITAIGSARGVHAVEVTPEVAGRLLALAVAPGDRVTAGDVIADLDDEAARLAAERARLVLADATATLERLDRLQASGSATSLQRQEAELALRTADLALQAAERDLADHRLIAPIGGYVGLIEVQVGNLLTPSSVVTRIEDRSSLILEFRVPERVAALIGPGDPVAVSAISAPQEPLQGRIVAVDNRVDDASRTLRVEAEIANPDDRLRAGMAFRVALEFTGKDYPAVDPLAIQWGSDGAFVWVVRGGKAVNLPIRILQRNAETVLVEAALEPGDLVVTEGVQALRPGADAQVAPDPKS
ncbi:MAG: efflux RND transporter periplasmic adaptor subunit [Rhodobacteraceae bacterium]|jgi:RND family efflux transporter MFP subunit|nr:efflux RND transporter periplasmic adaptor subunit [Paracoccaceae bacterium]